MSTLSGEKGPETGMDAGVGGRAGDLGQQRRHGQGQRDNLGHGGAVC